MQKNNQNNIETVQAQLNKEELIAFCRELVAIPSHYLVEGGETAVAQHIAGFLCKENIQARVDPVFKGRSNVEAVLTGKTTGKRVLLCGHLDTVLADNMDHEPFVAYVEGNKIWGRGAADMKGGNAAMVMAMVALKRADIDFAGELVYAGVCGEESPDNSEGTKYLLEKGSDFDYAIVGEATQLGIAGYHKGMSWLKVHIKGKAAHASHASQGINAVSIAARMIVLLEEVLVPKLKGRTHEYVSAASLSIGKINGGTQNNTVPDECWFSMDRRTIPHESSHQVIKEIEDLLESVIHQYPGASFWIEEEVQTQGRTSMQSGIDNPLVEAFSAAIARQTDQEAQIGGVDYWTDGAHLARHGATTIIFGPGNIAQAHASTEYIDVDELYDSACIYATAIIDLMCKGA